MSEVAADEVDALDGFPHPRETLQLFGHVDPQAALIAALRSGKMHHAWLLGGPRGIGKATLAYRAAKWLLAGGATGTQDRIEIDPTGRPGRLVAQLAHPDFIVLRRDLNKQGKISANIQVDSVRALLERFATTTSAGGFRIGVVDSADDLDRHGANALLKLVEEPPPRTVFFILAHEPAGLLPTIRSRCRKLEMRPLDEDDVRRAIVQAAPDAGGTALSAAVAASGGSVRRGLTRLDETTARLADTTLRLLQALPRQSLGETLKLAETLAGKAGEARFAVFIDTLETWLHETVTRRAAAGENAARLAPLAEVWDKSARAVREAEAFNLDRKPLVLTIIQDVAEALARSRAA
jgi:DNA polymerase-3 subunit delta'